MSVLYLVFGEVRRGEDVLEELFTDDFFDAVDERGGQGVGAQTAPVATAGGGMHVAQHAQELHHGRGAVVSS
jgi:hypothetical protein